MNKAMLALAAAAVVCGSQANAQQAAEPKAAAQTGRLFALLMEPGPAWKPGLPFEEQGLRDHFYYWMGLFRDGRVITAGPLGDDRGLVLLRVADQAEADAILAADPAIPAGIFTGTVRPYRPPMVNPALLSPRPEPSQKPGK